MEAEVSQLKRAVEQAHGGAATFVRSVPIREDIPAACGRVGSASSTSPAIRPRTAPGSRRSRTFAMLHHLPVDGPQAAVREQLVAGHRER